MPLHRPPQPERPPVTPPAPPEPAKPEPQPAVTLGSYGNASIDQWDSAFIAASDAVKRKKGVRVDPLIIKAMMDVETGGNGNYPASRCRASDGTDTVPACGPMQIKYEYHKSRCPECDFSTVPGQIELATHIIGDTMKAHGKDEYDALVTTYFPGGDVNGTTQAAYVNRVRSLVATMQGTTPEKPRPVTEADVLKLIAGPGAYVGFGFNQPNMSCGTSGREPCHFYAYGVGHGTTADYMHPGIDISVPRGTTLRTPLAGRVTCIGEQGEVIWDQGCGYFADTGGGIGNITVMTDAGLKLTFGHCSKPLVRYDQRVDGGQPVALSGTNRADHCHLDVVTKRNGSRWLNDPLPTLAAVLSGGEMPTAYPDPYDVPQPEEMDRFAKVIVTADELPVYQRASRSAPETQPRLTKGDEFLGAMQIIGPDGEVFWITSRKNRVPVKGTQSDDWQTR